MCHQSFRLFSTGSQKDHVQAMVLASHALEQEQWLDFKETCCFLPQQSIVFNFESIVFNRGVGLFLRLGEEDEQPHDQELALGATSEVLKDWRFAAGGVVGWLVGWLVGRSLGCLVVVAVVATAAPAAADAPLVVEHAKVD